MPYNLPPRLNTYWDYHRLVRGQWRFFYKVVGRLTSLIDSFSFFFFLLFFTFYHVPMRNFRKLGGFVGVFLLALRFFYGVLRLRPITFLKFNGFLVYVTGRGGLIFRLFRV